MCKASARRAYWRVRGNNDYNKKLEVPPTIEMFDPTTLDEMVNYTDLIIIGEVEERHNKVNTPLDPNSNTPEAAIQNKMKSQGFQPSDGPAIIPNRVKVKEVLHGNTTSKEITIIQSEIFEGYEPKLNKKDTMIFFLSKVSDRAEHYNIVHPYASYYYIKNNKLDPVYKKNEFTQLTGISIEDFKSKINNAKKK
ncbi:hypothetical protein [Paenibacillus sp. YYML68]|uniref:hypothetical protein n=1 Tax=Paenibacillus sp. YYML68 TaxID=2909250 RepID=UPI002492DDD6|nr:hypothetical protein [Paenibacillus sp. YYML68]